jgi:hypothetical protein
MTIAFTDYPLVELGDIPNQLAPIRQVEMVSYDANKYVAVRYFESVIQIKAGYLYKEPGRHGEVPNIDPTILPLGE